MPLGSSTPVNSSSSSSGTAGNHAAGLKEDRARRSTSSSDVAATKAIKKKGTPISKSEEILQAAKDFAAAWAEKMNYGYETPQQIAEWFTRKNQESQASWMGYQQKLQTAAMIGQLASGVGGALGQLAGGLAKRMGGGGGGGPGDTGATAARGGGGGGGCANGQCGRSPAAAAATTAWQENAGATDARTMAAIEPRVLESSNLADTNGSSFDMAQISRETQMEQLTTQEQEPPPPPPITDTGSVA